MPKVLHGKLQKRIVKELNAKPGELKIIPHALRKKLNVKDHSLSTSVKKLREKGYLLIFEGNVGTHIKGKNRVSRLQQKVVNSCEHINGAYKIPPRLYATLGEKEHSVAVAIQSLQKKGYVFIRSGQKGSHLLKRGILTETQQQVLNASKMEKGVYKIRKELPRRIKKPHSSVKEAIENLKWRGYKFKRTDLLTSNQKKVLEGCKFENGVYLIPAAIDKKINIPESSSNNAINALKRKGFVFVRTEEKGVHLKDRSKMTPLEQKIVNSTVYEAGIHRMPSTFHKKIK